MPVPESIVGRVYPPTEPYLVSREKIREFADAINDSNACHRSPEAARALGHPDVVAPPTFPIVLTIPAGHQLIFDPEVDIDYGRVVHGEQRFAYERPIVPGDVLTATLTVSSLRQIAGNDIIGTTSEITDDSGALVCSTSATLVHRGAES